LENNGFIKVVKMHGKKINQWRSNFTYFFWRM
jgi:hypothetical protein